jgi:hypothetical protein
MLNIMEKQVYLWNKYSKEASLSKGICSRIPVLNPNSDDLPQGASRRTEAQLRKHLEI